MIQISDKASFTILTANRIVPSYARTFSNWHIHYQGNVTDRGVFYPNNNLQSVVLTIDLHRKPIYGMRLSVSRGKLFSS